MNSSQQLIGGIYTVRAPASPFIASTTSATDVDGVSDERHRPDQRQARHAIRR
jgi:hypothetical protein